MFLGYAIELMKRIQTILSWENCKQRFLPDLLFLGILLLLLLLSCLLAGLEDMRGTRLFFLQATVLGPPGLFSPSQILNWLTQSASDPISTIFQQVIAWLGRQGSLLTFTDPGATYNNPSVRELWGAVLAIADSIIAIFIVLAGYRIILGGFGTRYTEALEELPRLIAAFIGANVSLLFARFWIDLNNLLCAVMMAQTANHPLSDFSVLTSTPSIVAIFPLVALLGILIIFLGIQMTVRLALILFLIVCMPVMFILLASTHTRHVAHAGINSYIVTTLVQALQLTTLVLGIKVLFPFLIGSIGSSTVLAPVATVLAGLGLFWVTLRIPSMLRQWALQPIAESGDAARSIIVALVARRFL